MIKKLINPPFLIFFLIFLSLIYFFTKSKLPSTSLITSKEFSEPEAIRILDIISKTPSNKLAKLVILQEENYRKELKKNIEDMQSKITEFCKNNNYACKKFNSEKIIKRMLKDKEILLDIGNLAWKNNKLGDEIIYTNNMPEAIDHAIDILKNKSSVQTILAGKMLSDIYIDWDMPTLLGGVANKDKKGTHDMLGFITSLGYIAHSLKIPLDSYSALSYNINLPDHILDNSEIKKFLVNYTFFANKSIMLFYNGQETGSFSQKIIYYPKDSSLWLAEIIGIQGKINTLNLMSLHSEYNNKGFILWDNNSIVIKEKIEDELSIVSANTIKDILPGMIICERYFNLSQDIGYSEGIGGRIGIVIGVDYENNNILAMSYMEDISRNINGFGIDIYEYKKQNSVLQMFFILDNDK